jgi:uncharacterized protein YjbI with pentapeptide repeats
LAFSIFLMTFSAISPSNCKVSNSVFLSILKLNVLSAYAYFWNTQCQGASFRDAQCQGVNFWGAQCQGADFWGAQCQGADFLGAQCQGANFRDAQCQGADFRNAQCQGAYALKTFSFRIDKNTEFETLQLEGEIAENVVLPKNPPLDTVHPKNSPLDTEHP